MFQPLSCQFFGVVSKTCNLGYPPCPPRVTTKDHNIFVRGSWTKPSFATIASWEGSGESQPSKLRVPTPECPESTLHDSYPQWYSALLLATIVIFIGEGIKKTDWLPGGWPTTICESDFWICMFNVLKKETKTTFLANGGLMVIYHGAICKKSP